MRLRGRNVHGLLATTVDEAAILFADAPAIADRLRPLIGRGPRLSRARPVHGDALGRRGAAPQDRLVPARRRGAEGAVLFVFDEPTTGLAPSDVDVLLAVFRAAPRRGTFDRRGRAQHGVSRARRPPRRARQDGGPDGGRVVFEGAPADLAARGGTPGASALRGRVQFRHSDGRRLALRSLGRRPRDRALGRRGDARAQPHVDGASRARVRLALARPPDVRPRRSRREGPELLERHVRRRQAHRARDASRERRPAPARRGGDRGAHPRALRADRHAHGRPAARRAPAAPRRESRRARPRPHEPGPRRSPCLPASTRCPRPSSSATSTAPPTAYRPS